MTKTHKKEPLGTPRQIRFPSTTERDLQTFADAHGLEWVDAVRLAARIGLPILKRKMGEAVKQAA